MNLYEYHWTHLSAQGINQTLGLTLGWLGKTFFQGLMLGTIMALQYTIFGVYPCLSNSLCIHYAICGLFVWTLSNLHFCPGNV